MLAVFSQGLRAVLLAYVYWNTLRLRFWAPESRPYHMQVRRWCRCIVCLKG